MFPATRTPVSCCSSQQGAAAFWRCRCTELDAARQYKLAASTGTYRKSQFLGGNGVSVDLVAGKPVSPVRCQWARCSSTAIAGDVGDITLGEAANIVRLYRSDRRGRAASRWLRHPTLAGFLR